MSQRDRRGGMTAEQLRAGGLEQHAMIRDGQPVIVELYASSRPASPWCVSLTRTTPAGHRVTDITEHTTLKQARQEFRSTVRTYQH